MWSWSLCYVIAILSGPNFFKIKIMYISYVIMEEMVAKEVWNSVQRKLRGRKTGAGSQKEKRTRQARKLKRERRNSPKSLAATRPSVRSLIIKLLSKKNIQKYIL